MTAPTLPAMTDIECEDLIGWADGRWHDSEYRIDARDLMNFVRHVASERDAQWAARLDAAVRDERQEIDEGLRLAVERTRDDLGPTGHNYPAVRKLLDFAERAIRARTKD